MSHEKSSVNGQAQGLKRVKVAELDQILGVVFKVLDDGFIRVIDYMGSDESIVKAARVSYGQGTKIVHEDRGLIRYLMRHGHTTPFEMCEMEFHIRAPMDCWRQWIRHRTANVNEYSTRYSIAIDATQKTRPDQWRKQSAANRQGSSTFLDSQTGQTLSEKEQKLHEFSRMVYEERLQVDVAREQARKDLPLSTYTEAYWKIDLHNLLHFLSLRMDSYAQLEIRSYANIIGREIVRKWCPLTWEAFLEYRMNSMTLSSIECNVLKAIISGDSQNAEKIAKEFGWLDRVDRKLKLNRERAEFEYKLKQLGLPIPWEDSA